MEIKLNSPDYGENFNDGTVSVGATDPQTEFHLFREDARLTVQTEIEDNLIALDFSTYPDLQALDLYFILAVMQLHLMMEHLHLMQMVTLSIL